MGDDFAFRAQHWANFTQKAYPLKYVRKMIKQLKAIQDSVQALGMKPAEREDWAGVRMHLIRIFQQEQFIFQKVDRERNPIPSDLFFYAGTREPDALVTRILFRINPTYETVDHLGQKKTHRYDPRKIVLKNLEKKAHCLKLLYDRTSKSFMGVIQLKDFVELSEVADLLGAGQPTDGPVDRKYLAKLDCAIEACEVRGRIQDILNGNAIIKKKSKEGQAIWKACNVWKLACQSESLPGKTNWEQAPKGLYVKKSLGTNTPRYYTYDDEPCFNLVSGIMQAREDIWQKNSIRILQRELEEERRESRRNRADIQGLYKLLANRNILPTKGDASTASEESLISNISRQPSRREGELRKGQQTLPRQGEASPLPAASSDAPVLGPGESRRRLSNDFRNKSRTESTEF